MKDRRESGAGRDTGAAVVWALALVTVLMLAGLLAAAVAQQALVRQRVATSADLAALAGAQALGDPCVTAERLAAQNDTTLMACAIDGSDVVVRVAGPAPSLVRRLFALLGSVAPEVVGIARAGPPSDAVPP